jgi:hypothetical protein
MPVPEEMVPARAEEPVGQAADAAAGNVVLALPTISGFAGFVISITWRPVYSSAT